MKKLRILLLLDSNTGYDRDLLTGIARYVRTKDSWIIFRESPEYRKIKGEEYYATHINKIKPDGIIATENHLTKDVLNSKIPLVISPFSKIYNGSSNILVNDDAVGTMGAAYFVNKGFKNFAFCGYEGVFWSEARAKSFKVQLKRNGFNVSSFWYPKSNTKVSWTSTLNNIAKWLTDLPKPLALMTSNDDICIEIVEAAKLVNLKIPDELAILSVDNDKLICEMSTPPISSIELNSEEVGYKSAELLEQIILRNSKPSNIIGKPLFVVERQSTNIVALTDSDVVAAMRFINEFASSKNIYINEIVNVNASSRRTLEKKFQLYLKYSILDEIKRVRINQMMYLLLNTTLSVSEISIRMDFSSSENASRFFKDMKGVTPIQFRNSK